MLVNFKATARAALIGRRRIVWPRFRSHTSMLKTNADPAKRAVESGLTMDEAWTIVGVVASRTIATIRPLGGICSSRPAHQKRTRANPSHNPPDRRAAETKLLATPVAP